MWGAQGGGWGSHDNAPGGYSDGWKILTKNQVLYVVVGGKGIDASHYTDGTSYNGGGIQKDTNNKMVCGGGGATHIATKTGLLKDLSSNKTSVICVAGGAGSNGAWSAQGPNYQSGGGLVGLGSAPTGGPDDTPTKHDTGGTQTGCGPDGIKGGFGYGGSPDPSIYKYACGGGGWYGGNASGGGVSSNVGGGGGSGYIGGLTNGRTIAGNASMPSPTGGTETGHYGNGYAIISWHPAL